MHNNATVLFYQVSMSSNDSPNNMFESKFFFKLINITNQIVNVFIWIQKNVFQYFLFVFIYFN